MGRYQNSELHCTGVAVGLKPLDQRVHLPFRYMITGGKTSHGIGYFVAGGNHIIKVGEKVDIVRIIKADTGFSYSVEQFAVKFQDFKYGHVAIFL